MLERYLEQHEAIRTALCMLEKNDLVVSADSNGYIQEMIRILKPFEAVTTELSAEKHVSASKILPLARGLQRVTIANQNEVCHEICENLISQMATRFAKMEEKGVIAVATLLHPRF